MNDLINRLRKRAYLVTVRMGEDAGLYNLLTEAANALDGRMWIPVSERLPENNATVLALSRYYNGEIDQWVLRHVKEPDAWFFGSHPFISTITHWMPLPNNPKEGDDE